MKKVGNVLKWSSHDVNAFGAHEVMLVDFFGPICEPLIQALRSFFPYMFYILVL